MGADGEDVGLCEHDMFAQAAFASPKPTFTIRPALCPCCHNYLCGGEGHGGKSGVAATNASTTSSSSSVAACFEALDDDALLTIARACGRELTTFAAINATCRRLAASTPNVWKQAYGTTEEDVADWGDLPESMWRSCLLHSTAKHARAREKNRIVPPSPSS